MEAHEIIKYPLSTEKAIRLLEAENKMIFVVDRKAKKPQIKEAVEALFKGKVTKISTYITPKGNKRAYIKFDNETPAIDIATNLGLM